MTHVDGGGVPAGTQLNGIYEIEKRLAIGGMGEVYIGRVIQTGDKVAIKMILPEHANNEVILDLFRKEASTLHNLYHEAIVRYYVFSVDPTLNRPYLSMEFAAGPSLGDRLREAPLKEERMVTLRQRVAGGLYAAHKLGVIHRDISPDNIILVDGEVGKAKIIDFGIAKSTTSEGTLIGSGFAGKLKYVSPEQLGLFGGDVTGKSDIYSLGLVFAEAVIGQPLPMGGSQVEVIEKRRSVPDLSQVPEWIRPLIESMIQPNPDDRPADMQAVANWTPAGSGAAAAPAAAASAPRSRPHPRDARRAPPGAGQEERRKGAPWLWIGAGGIGIAAAAAAAFVLVGGEPEGAPGGGTVSGGTLAPADGDPAPTGEIRLAAPDSAVVAPAAEAGTGYSWTSTPFTYDGNPADLVFTPDGTLPSGITLGDSADGAARLSGTPAEPGAYDFAVVAAAPSGQTARMAVSLQVEEGDEQIALATPPATPAAPAGTLTAPSETDSGALTLGGASGGDGTALTPGDSPTLAPAAGAGSTPTVPPQDEDPTTGSVEPTVSTGLPGALSAPSDGGDPGSVASGGAGVAPLLGQPAAPTLAPGTAGGAPTVPPQDEDPTADAPEPEVATGVPGGLSAPSVQGGSTLGAQSGGGDLPLPKTGAAAQTLQPGGATGDSPVIAAIPTPENQPPTIESAASGPLDVAQGQPVNARIGSFFDEEGPSAMTLKVEGTVPNGLAIRLAEGGVAQLYGTPAEFGDYQIRVAAVDPQGMVSESIPVSLSIAPPTENKDVRDYILGYNGGDCFLSRPLNLGPQLAQIEVFADQNKVQPVLDFDAAFKRDMGFEAAIGMRPISEQQCPLIHALDQVGPQALDNSLVIDLDRDELVSGDELQGKIRGGAGASLFLYDHLGGLTDLSQFVETTNGETGFSLPVTASGPQILIAARPREGADVQGTAGLEELLGAAQRGQASLALGFFIMK